MKYNTAAELERVTYLGLKAVNSMAAHFVVDRHGAMFDLGEVEPQSPLNWLRRALYLISNPVIEARYPQVHPKGRADIAEVQSLVCRDLDENAEFWWDRGDPEELKAQVRSCTTISQIMDLF